MDASRHSMPLPDAGSPSAEPPREAVLAATERLPARQREALALRQSEGLSYDRIAAVMGTSRSSVAQLISRARINLSDELHGTVLASIAAPSPQCERALPLIAMREDDQLDPASPDAAWLDGHLAECDRCRLGIEAMGEASASYRAWAPIAQTTANGASATPPVDPPGSGPVRPRRRRAAIAVGLAAMLALVGLAALIGDDPASTPLDPAAGAATKPGAAAAEPGAKAAKAARATKQGTAKKGKRQAGAEQGTAGEASSGEAASLPSTIPAETGDGDGDGDGGAPASRPNRPSGESAVEPTRRASTPGTNPKPKQTTAAPPPPTSSPTPTATAPSATTEPPEETNRRREPPGKPANRPPR